MLPAMHGSGTKGCWVLEQAECCCSVSIANQGVFCRAHPTARSSCSKPCNGLQPLTQQANIPFCITVQLACAAVHWQQRAAQKGKTVTWQITPAVLMLQVP